MANHLTLGLQWLPLEWIVPVLAGLVVALFASWAWEALIRGAWAFGFDASQKLAYTIPPVRFILFVGVWTSVALPAGEEDPENRLLIGGFLTLLVTIWAFRHFRDIAAGLTISIVRPFALGDQLGTPQASGRLVSLGLTRSKLRTPSGTWVDVPNSELMASTVRVSSKSRGALPVEIHVSIPSHCDPDIYLGGLRDETLLSAYTDASSPVVIELLDATQVKITATPTHPDDTDELRSDLMGRSVSMRQEWDTREA
jgi:hypothetical protein